LGGGTIQKKCSGQVSTLKIRERVQAIDESDVKRRMGQNRGSWSKTLWTGKERSEESNKNKKEAEGQISTDASLGEDHPKAECMGNTVRMVYSSEAKGKRGANTRHAKASGVGLKERAEKETENILVNHQLRLKQKS